MADVFLSYSAEDRARVESLVRAIEADGLTVWWDRRIGTGSSFDVVIERELDSAGCVVVAWTTHSVGSEWVRNEATEGAERGVLVPLQLDDVRAPLAFRRRQTAQLFGWPNGSHDESLKEVIDSIRRIVGDDRPVVEVIRGAPQSDRLPIVVAVLPLSDRTPEGNMDYLCDGLAEDLINALFAVNGLRILSSTDTFAFRDTTTGTREIGAVLAANLVLEGSVQRAGDRLAVSVRLIQVGDGVTIYSERFQRGDSDVFALQSEVAGAVVVGLREKLGLVGASAVPLSRARDPIAFAMLKAAGDPMDLAASIVRGGLVTLRRIVALECAIALDPSLDRAYADLVPCYLYADTFQVASHAKANALLAQLELNRPDSPLIWEIRAELESDMTALASVCHQMIARGERMYPYAHPTGLRDVRGVYGRALAHLGLHREALAYLTLVDRSGEPNLHAHLLFACGCLVACGEFDRALEMCRRTRGLIPTAYYVAPTWELIAHLATGDIAAALSVPPDLDIWHHAFGLPLLLAKQSGTPIDDAAPDEQAFPRELRAYALLAVDEVERGVEHLVRSIRESDRERHWVRHRIPIFSVLFSPRVKAHAGYRTALELANLDDASRERSREQVATLTRITGVEVGPLLPL